MQLLEQLITQACSAALSHGIFHHLTFLFPSVLLNRSQNVDLPQLLKNLDPCRLKTVITGEEVNVQLQQVTLTLLH